MKKFLALGLALGLLLAAGESRACQPGVVQLGGAYGDPGACGSCGSCGASASFGYASASFAAPLPTYGACGRFAASLPAYGGYGACGVGAPLPAYGGFGVNVNVGRGRFFGRRHVTHARAVERGY